MSVRAYIVAAGGANYGSLREACRRVGVDADLGDDPARIRNATHVILPGVGAAAQAMAALRARGLDRVLQTVQQPLLGICLGMQLLFEHSSEASRTSATDDVPERSTECLGIVPGNVQRLPPSPSWPHMGWNQIVSDRAAHPLLDGLAANDWYYFVHGYAAQADASTIAHCDHGLRFSAAIAHDNVHGTQFHPEKSALAGRRLLSNFLSLT